MPDPAKPHFIAFISRREEIADYTSLRPAADFTFASFSDLGADAIRVDPNRMHDVIAVFSRLHDRKPFTAVLNRKEKCVVPAARMASALGLPPIASAPELARDKYAMRQSLTGGGSFPRTVLIRDAGDLDAVDATMFPCVLKPRFGFNSRAAVLTADRRELVAAYREHHERYSRLPKQDCTSADFVVEELIPGAEHNVETLVRNGAPLFHLLSDKLPMDPPYFVEIGDDMPSRLPPAGQAACREAADRAIRNLGILNGWTHTEVKLSGTTAIVVECAARMGGGYFENLFREVYGVNRLEMAMAIHLDAHPTPTPLPRACAAARRLVVYGPRRMRTLENAEALFANQDVRLIWPANVAAIDRELAGPPFEFNNTLVEFMVLGSSGEKAALLANRLVADASVRTAEE